jgi:hypothetical protein
MNRKRTSLAFIIALAILAGACVFPGLAAPAPANGDPAGTAAAQTANALMTQVVVKTVMAYMTSAPSFADVTQMPATATLAPSSTPLTLTPTATKRPPTATPLPPTATPLPCNAAHFVADVTMPDGEIVEAGKKFTKTWRLQNAGSCIWTTDYTLVFVEGNAMGGVTPVKIPKIVLPNEMVNVSIDLTVPQEAGRAIGYYQLKTDQGVQFGIGASATKSFYVRLNVTRASSKLGEVYALYNDVCAATWVTSSADPLACPSVASPNGGVLSFKDSVLEGNRPEDEFNLVVYPSSGKDGYIQGMFPAVTIRSGNRFAGIIGCLANSDDCSVTFKLQYTEDNGKTVHDLGSWPQLMDGKMDRLNLDLSALDGKSVRLILKVLNNGDSTEDRAFWLMPRVLLK